MLLEDSLLETYLGEIESLYLKYINDFSSNATHFGLFEGDDLQAVASLKGYDTEWYLRGCVVKPEFRGQGMQRILLRERLAYLSTRTPVVRVGIYPGNTISIRNVECEGFEFEKNKILSNKKLVYLYKKELAE